MHFYLPLDYSSQDVSLMARLLTLAEGSENESPHDIDAPLSASQSKLHFTLLLFFHSA